MQEKIHYLVISGVIKISPEKNEINKKLVVFLIIAEAECLVLVDSPHTYLMSTTGYRFGQENVSSRKPVANSHVSVQ